MKYLGTGSVKIAGAATGTTYEFSSLNPEVYVDPRDASEFLKTLDFVFARSNSN